MFKFKKRENWTESYISQIQRNIGLFNREEQEKIRTTKIAILGLGGIGGSTAEQLIRTGCEQFILCDNEKFEVSNLNRQLCTIEDLNKYKVDVIENRLKKVNPQANIQTFYNIDEKNISDILNGVKIVALCLDGPIASILIARESLKRDIPIIESYAIPYIWTWWFTSESIDYETCYHLSTHKLSISEIEKSSNFKNKFKEGMLSILLKFPNISKTYSREPNILDAVIRGQHPLVSIAPIVRLTASFLSFDLLYSGILKIKKMNLAPSIIGYDYLRMKEIKVELF
ncbi:MAG: ThiF family adenylyltransferase [Promethearchaeota archaeon]